jgi:hypothetical protein
MAQFPHGWGMSLQQTIAQKEPIELAITDQQRLEAEVRLCVDWLPSPWGLCNRTGSGPVKKIEEPLAGLVFWRMTSSSWLRAPLYRRGTFVSRLSRTFRKFPATLGLHSDLVHYLFAGSVDEHLTDAMAM